jgi:hypothetical protein
MNSPRQTRLRLRLADGWRLISAKAGNQPLKLDDRGTADITALKGNAALHFQAELMPRK